MNFTKSERNKDRKTSQKYSRRNTIWKCIQPLCNNGMSSDVLQLIEFGRHMDINTRWSKIIDCMIGPRGPNRNSAASLGWGRRCLTPIYGRIQINSDQKFYRAQRRNYYVWDLVRKSLRGTRRSLCRTYQL